MVVVEVVVQVDQDQRKAGLADQGVAMTMMLLALQVVHLPRHLQPVL